jgi:hypothetical protein
VTYVIHICNLSSFIFCCIISLLFKLFININEVYGQISMFTCVFANSQAIFIYRIWLDVYVYLRINCTSKDFQISHCQENYQQTTTNTCFSATHTGVHFSGLTTSLFSLQLQNAPKMFQHAPKFALHGCSNFQLSFLISTCCSCKNIDCLKLS